MKRENIVVGLDLSSEQIRAVAGLWDKNESKIRIIGSSQIKASGLQNGLVTDMVAASHCLSTVIKDLRNETGGNPEQVYLGISGEHLQGFKSDVNIKLSNQKSRQVKRADLAYLNKLSSNVKLPLDRCLVQRTIQDYSIDDQCHIRNPIGMTGMGLRAHSYLITGSRAVVANLKKCLLNAGCFPRGFVMAGIAAGYSLIDETEQQGNYVLINIRDLTTDVVMYSRGNVHSAEVFGSGQRNFIEQIARVLNLPLDVAEKIKQKYGCVQTKLVRPGERVMIPGNGGSKSIARQELAQIIEPAAKELFFKIKESIERKNNQYAHVEKVIITGTDAKMEGTIEVTEEIFERPVRLGLARNIVAEAMILNFPEWSTAMGLVANGLKQDPNPQDAALGLAAPWITRFKNWIEEYF